MPLNYSLALLAALLSPIASAQLSVPTWRDTGESCSVQSVMAAGPQEVVLSFTSFSPSNVFSADLRLNYPPSLTAGNLGFFCLDQTGNLTGNVQCAVSSTSALCVYSGGVAVRECRLRASFASAESGTFAPVFSFSGSLTGIAVAGGAALPFKVVDPWELIYGDSFEIRPSPPDCHITPPLK